jgi:hypothetical protein
MGITETSHKAVTQAKELSARKLERPHEIPRHRLASDDNPTAPRPGELVAPPPKDDPLNPLDIEDRRKMLGALAERGDDRQIREAIMDLTRVEQLTGQRKDLGPGPPLTPEERRERFQRLAQALNEGMWRDKTP